MSPRPPKVLLIDDDAQALKQVGDALYQAGWHVQLLQHPTLAVATARTFQPDLVILDFQMPVLNGREVAQALRAFEDTAKLPFVFLVTSQDIKEQVRLLQSGAVDVWKKPFVPGYLARLSEALQATRARADLPPQQRARGALLQMAERDKFHGTLSLNPGTPFEGKAIFVQGELHLARLGPFTGERALDEMLGLDETVWRFEPGATADSAAEPPTPKVEGYVPHVLFVDDQPELRTLGARQLERAGFKVATAEHGEEGLARTRNADFDVIVADLNMPVLDGWGMLRLLRASPRTREIPLLFLSAHDDYRETLKAAKAGARDYLAKTGRSDQLLRHVRILAAPRQATFELLKAGKEVGAVELVSVGPAWLLRTVGELELTAVVEVQDELPCRWRLDVQRGRVREAFAQLEHSTRHGTAAIGALFGAVGARAYVKPCAHVGPADPKLPHLVDEVERACRQHEAVEARMMDDRIDGALRFTCDAELYGLFLRVASDRDVRLARAVCEQKLSTDALPEALGLPPAEIREALREMVRRGVLTPDEPDLDVDETGGEA